jgi:hypothetical protein
MRPEKTRTAHHANDRRSMPTLSVCDRPGTSPGDAPVKRRALDGPVLVYRASSAGRCAVCQARYGRGVQVSWLPGSGPCHAQCAPAGTQAQSMRAARFLAGHAADAAELRELLVMVGLISPQAAYRDRLARRVS